MEELVEKYKECISKNNNNSYKYILGLSILLIRPSAKIIKFEEIADKVVEIYFRNIFKYNLIEYKNKNQLPKVQQDMQSYFDKNGMVELLSLKQKKELIDLVVANKNNGFFKYVLPCFTGAKKDENGKYIYPNYGCNKFFSYDINKEEIILTDEFFETIIKRYHELKYVTIEEYIKYLRKRNEDNYYIEEIINYY